MYIDDDESSGPLLAASARRHGVGELDVRHAYAHPIRVWIVEDGFTMIVGGDRAGRLLEVGSVRSDDGTDIVIHAMPARTRFLPKER